MIARFSTFCLLGLVLVLGASACDRTDPAPEPREPYGITSYSEDGLGAAVLVQVLSLAPSQQVEAITLIDPAGGRYPARQILHTRYENGPYPRQSPDVGGTVGVHGGSGGGGGFFGIGLGIPLGGGGSATTAPQGDEAQARFLIDDPQSYRQTAGAWRIEIILSDASGRQGNIDLAAPVP